ncbi:helicase-related protein [Blastopirellula retiformator]|uniref:RNA polymerase-associated protein RapA n=1 Tax=Blastopirellula retiformator TaxID=2527970 RepID=A0A5C5UX43_9BACT|nr:helicase-related protein [Blastopirellula retiformator]TWT30127.1 RNA polymerase-associated protein RapA [Blastopirellula retiformator]
MSVDPSAIRQGCILSSPTLPEPIEVLATVPMGDSLKVIGRGCTTGLTHDPVLSRAQLADVRVSADREPFDGNARMFRLGIEANRLGLAYEYDPFFSLSIARVDPLPHQLEAVYSYFMKLPRIRFLLADDPGAGKTIMAGLLLKELKARGLVRRVLIVAPASLTFQWQREMADKFREKFEVIRGDVLRANYGQNPWQERDQVVTSVSWVSIVEDARESLLRSRWDLVIVDEAHKMSARSEDHKTYAYRLGENLSKMTDHYLLMTATPHKGDPEHFRRFLALLDADVYGSIQSLEQAMKDHEAPFYLRRTKEALVTFPDADTGEVRKLFTKREVRSVAFDLDGEELEFYDELTRYVEDQSMMAAADGSARGRAVGFTMAMLQRRMASSIYAVRRSLERMRTRREKILADPEAYRQEQIQRRVPDDFDDLDTEEQQQIIDDLENEVLSVDPAALREEIAQLTRLVQQAVQLEERDIQTKIIKLRSVLNEEGIFDSKKNKLLIFTEHKDTLDFLAADGKDGRPLGKLIEWGLSVTQIHGGMKIGDRDTPGTRIYAERAFKEECQIMVATEAAGEGINLQFCWLMINFDIPWNPVRLEQRVGRIHRYGQEKDCLIFNFVAQNTREGRVLRKLLDRLAEIRADLGSDQVFDVVGEVFPANQLERMLRDMYARQTDVSQIEDRIVRDVSPERFRAITESTLEGLAKKELNLSNMIGKNAEAKERRLVPEVIEQFFVDASPECGMSPKETAKGSRVFRIGKVPRNLLPIGDRQEDRFGRLGREYKQVAFDKLYLRDDPTLEWVTPGHPLFETVRTDILARTVDHLRRGAVFYDLNRNDPSLIDVFVASIKDGRGRTLHRRLFAVETALSGEMKLHEPTVLLDIAAAPEGAAGPAESITLPTRQSVEQYLYENALAPWIDRNADEQRDAVERIRRHVEISLNALINRAQLQQAEYISRQIEGETVTGLDGLIAQAEQHLDELTNRLESRRKELELERHTSVSDISHLGRVWVAPHPDRATPQFAPMVRDDEIERIAVQEAIRYEEARGWVVESVESENRGFDLISRRPHPEDPKTFLEVRFIEVKGRAGVGVVALSENEYRTAERLRADYWLYAVFNCASSPELHVVHDPARLGWQPILAVEHYQLNPSTIIEAST